MSQRLSIEQFQPHLGDAFTLDRDEGPARELELVAVVDMSSGREAAGGPASFSLEFRSDPGIVLQQRIYHLKHETLGELEFFLVPVGPDDEGMRYESLFNYDAV